MDYSYVYEVLRKQWTKVRRPRFSVIGNSWFLIGVDSEEDIRSVLAKGAWKVGARTLIASQWTPGQEMKITAEQTVLLWIHLPGLPVNLWNKYSYQSMAKSINGVFVASDQCTTKREKLGFARIQLEVPKVDTNDSVYPEQSPWDKLTVRVKQKVLIKGGWEDNIPSQAHRTLHAMGREHKELVATSPQASSQNKALDQRRTLQSDETVADLGKKKAMQKNLEGHDWESHPLSEPSHGTLGTCPIPLASNPFHKGDAGAAAQRDIISLLNDVKPDVVFLLDTLVKETIIRSIALRIGFEGVVSNQQQAEGIAKIACFWRMGRLSAVQCQASRWWIELAFKTGDYNSSVKVFGVYLPNNPTLRSNCYCLLKEEINKNLCHVTVMGDCNAMRSYGDKTSKAAESSIL
ncbi:hypothetical protein EJ110_NYTH50142 [Nymphaea thermarum]|nr:hypothetical protein EJ110_NYTH50142 [Nymphaea thermarum]